MKTPVAVLVPSIGSCGMLVGVRNLKDTVIE